MAVSSTGAIWAADQQANALTYLADAQATPASIDIGAAPLCLWADGARAWVGCADGKARCFDANGLLGTFALPFTPRTVSQDGLGRLWFLDTATGAAASVWGR
ncbi:hypothetical protein D3C87_1720340 [compost metagenome]